MVPYILVIEDDVDLAAYLEDLLKEKNFMVKVCHNGATSLNFLDKKPVDLVLLDLTLPDMDGQFLCSEIKKRYPEISVVMLTARDGLEDKIKSFKRGADDYLTKPFEPDELFARITARLKKVVNSDNLEVGDLKLNPKTIEVTRGDNKIKLTPQEFKLLEYLMSNKGIVLSRDVILNRIWLYASDVDTRVVDVYIGYLRKKIDAGNAKKLIHSVRGFGYTIKE